MTIKELKCPLSYKILLNIYDLHVSNKNKKARDHNTINSTQLTEKVKSTYSHVSALLKLFKEKGIINIIKSGRTNIISITSKGKEVCLAVIILHDNLYKIKNGEKENVRRKQRK